MTRARSTLVWRAATAATLSLAFSLPLCGPAGALGAGPAGLDATSAQRAPATSGGSGSAGRPGALLVPEKLPARRFRPGAVANASSKRVADVSAVGTRTNGRIFAYDPQGGEYTCSGTAINTPSRSIVLTAGHCVVEHGQVARRISFVPAFDHEARPFGTFLATKTFVMPQWLRSENPDFDLAAFRVAPNRLGLLTNVVGGRGYATGRSRFSHFQIFGYPAAALQGRELRDCPSRGLGSDPLTFIFPGPPTMPGSCDMAAGASGGGWLLSGQYVNGVTSYGYSGNLGRLYSPYFGSAVKTFLSRLP